MLHSSCALFGWGDVGNAYNGVWTVGLLEGALCKSLFESWQGKFRRHCNIDFCLFGDLCHIVWCGVFGAKGMLDDLRDANGHC